jgi:hypothetical protein
LKKHRSKKEKEKEKEKEKDLSQRKKGLVLKEGIN